MKEYDIRALPAFGSTIPGQGGSFAAIVRGLTIAGVQQPADAIIVADRQHHAATTWGKYGHAVPGCTSRTDGQTNTLAMLDADCPAAKHARSLTVDGHSDYYLPSIGELNTAAANAPELFDPESVVWASTQVSSNGAFVQDFEYGISSWYYKVSEYLVVPVRRVNLSVLLEVL